MVHLHWHTQHTHTIFTIFKHGAILSSLMQICGGNCRRFGTNSRTYYSYRVNGRKRKVRLRCNSIKRTQRVVEKYPLPFKSLRRKFNWSQRSKKKLLTKNNPLKCWSLNWAWIEWTFHIVLIFKRRRRKKIWWKKTIFNKAVEMWIKSWLKWGATYFD